MQKNALAIHDISCVGRCSLTVALPILSSVGIETSVLPTAVLSTHTGGFTGYTFRDLTDDLDPISAHWKSLGLTFDSIYTGYLGSFRQLSLVSRITDEFSHKSTLVMVDPVMGDHGRLYANFTESFAAGFRELCKKADIITPNLTEAALLTGEPYKDSGYSKSYIEDIMKRLSETGPEKIVLTGVSFSENSLGCAAYDRSKNETTFIFDESIPGIYHGTGDVFASVLLASLLCGFQLPEAASEAVTFTAAAIRRTNKSGRNPIYGVDFEHGIADFAYNLINGKS